MKVLLDEMMPVALRHHLPGHEVFSIEYMGWKSKRNGELMALMLNHGFDAMLTNDQNMREQQAPDWVQVPLLVTQLSNTKLSLLLEVIPDILRLLATNPPPGFHPVRGPATP